MSKEVRPSSCRLHASTRYVNHANQHQGNSKRLQNQPTDSIQIKVSLKQRQPNHASQLLTVDSDSKTVINSSRSKFLQKFNTIRSSRESIDLEKSPNIEKQRRRKEEFQINKKQLFISNKNNNKSSNNTLTVFNPFQQNDFPVVDSHTHRTIADRKRSRPLSPSVEFVELRKISITELILLKEEGRLKHSIEQTLNGYWKGENRYVSLIPLARNQKVSFEHPNVLPIYAEVTFNAKRYVISDEYKNCSLKNLLQQFGPFTQQLSKRYLKQIALGLQHMHYHRRGHNRLSTTAILYNKNGELFINAVRSTSFVLSKEELRITELHYVAPEFLLSKGYSKSLKNDVWALGCLAIIMLTNTPLQLSPLHPYNFHNFQSSTEYKMIDNLKQLHCEYFSHPFQAPKGIKTFRQTLSDSAKNFISRCLQPLSDERPNIETLLQDEFLQGI